MENLIPLFQKTAIPHSLCLILCICLLSGCQSQKEESHRDYTLVEEEGIFAERFDSTNIADTRYTDDNITFKSGTRFLYSYRHVSREGEDLFFRHVPTDINHFSSWRFVPADSVSGNTIQQVKITVQPGLQPMVNNSPDYNQTVIKYEYPVTEGQTTFSSHSGVIENEKNIWMHPPRDQYFRILELNPFPFIKAPFEVGNQWEWELSIGSFWGDERWKTWEGSITNQYQYEITDKKTLDTAFGALEVYEITATASSRIGETGLTAIFNPQYGFLNLEYQNIDGSSTLLELIEHEVIKE